MYISNEDTKMRRDIGPLDPYSDLDEVYAEETSLKRLRDTAAVTPKTPRFGSDDAQPERHTTEE